MWKLKYDDYLLYNTTDFSTFSHFSSLISRVLRGSCDARHHDGDDVLVDSQDVDQVRMLEENVIVHKSPFEKRNKQKQL